jgi:hypothetical protein
VPADAVLLFAVVSNLVGEVVSPGALRRSLERRGELHAVPQTEIARPSDAPPSLRENHG